MVTINKTVRQFSDLDLNFIRHPSTGDIVKSYDEDSINKNLRYLILTMNYERPFHPEIGCQLNGMLFELGDPVTIEIMRRSIQEAITNFEKRVSIVNIDLKPNLEQNNIEITIEYIIVNINQPVVFTMILTRTR